jgi:orotate phosphoribosyltransferase
MTRIESLVERARKLKEKGLTTGEIADELNVSRETALWLLTKAREDVSPPSDIYIEWKNIAKPSRLRYIAAALAEMILESVEEEPEVVVGVATSGIPLAAMVAEELQAEFSIYYPRKLKWEEEEKGERHRGGVFSHNFASITGKRCVIVDDIISTGRSIRETAESIEAAEGKVLCAAVIVDKRESDEVDSVPVVKMLKIFRI